MEELMVWVGFPVCRFSSSRNHHARTVGGPAGLRLDPGGHVGPEVVADLLEKLTAFRALQKNPIERIEYRPPPEWKPTSFAIPEQ